MESSRLFKTLYYDSIAFSAYLFILSIINIVVALTALRSNKEVILIVLHRNIHSILSGRIILDIRRVGYEVNPSELPAYSSLIFGESLPNPISVQFSELNDTSEQNP